MKPQTLPILLTSLLVATTGFRKCPLDLTFEHYGNLPLAMRIAIFESLSQVNRLSLKAVVKYYNMVDQVEKLDKKTLRQLCAEGAALREEFKEYGW